ncbi:hypothetical protein A3Q56_05279 [Intoshia linei]|uniref:Protein quiver n=1 Tax=Intoshia linei TaxID=1819745 RepID=A0A177AYC0_9BILA|nr:hypothetical protein A3Q56_05279 [Intoshia linei]
MKLITKFYAIIIDPVVYTTLKNLYVCVILAVLFLMTGAIYLTDHKGEGPIKCIYCSSIDNSTNCTDPFNTTMAESTIIQCQQYCVKWSFISGI